jgi:hypothetical protein
MAILGFISRIFCPFLAGVLIFLSVSATPAAAEKVTVRAGVHAGFGRLVFDWASAVGHSASISDRTLNIRFDRSVQPVFQNVRRVLRNYIADIRISKDGKTVLATLKAKFDLKVSTNGSKVVIDLLKSKSPASSARAEKKPESVKAKPPVRLGPRPGRVIGGKQKKGTARTANTAKPATRSGNIIVRAGHHADYGRLVFEWPGKTGFVVDRQGRSVTLRFDRSGAIDIAALRRKLPAQITAVTTAPSQGGLELGLIVKPEAQLRYFHDGNNVVFDVVAPGPPPRRVKTADEKTAAAKSARKSRAAARAASKKKKRREARRGLALISIDASRVRAENFIRFNWRRPVEAAVFERPGSLWVVFDSAARIDIAAAKVVGGSLFYDISEHVGKDTVALKFSLDPGQNVSTRRDGNFWVIESGPKPKRKLRPLKLEFRKNTPYGTEIAVLTENMPKIKVIWDKITGDAVYVVPFRQTGRGISVTRRFPDFVLLKSHQGIAIRPLDDKVRVRAEKNAIVIYRPGGLRVSPESELIAGVLKPGKQRKILNFVDWRYGPEDDYQKIEHKLLARITQNKGTQRNAARLGLARFYVSYGLGAEALGVIGALLRENPGLLRDPGVRALRGISKYLIKHFAEALDDMSDSSLNPYPEILPWRGAIAGSRGDWTGAHRFFNGTDSTIALLPPLFAVPLGLVAAEASLSVGDIRSAQLRLNIIDGLPATSGQRDYLTFLKGHLSKQKILPKRALSFWKSVRDGGDRPSRAKAEFAIVNAQLDAKEIELPEAIDRLEALKFAWRNSVFEYDLLHKLSSLYASQDRLRDALVTLRQAVGLYQNVKGAQALTQDMRNLFRRFYLGGDADKLEPVVALGLFNEFRELTPNGPDGDQMIRNLTEKLIKVDLLEDAATLLDHQVKFRATGVNKARIGTRLAEILMLDEKPAKALAALDASRDDKIDADLGSQRRQLRARALLREQRFKESFAVLADEFDARSDLIRAEINWQAGRWYDASRALALATGRFDPENLTGQQVDLLLRRTVALRLADDQEGVTFLQERFGQAMERSKRAIAFKVVAGTPLSSIPDYNTFVKQAAELGTFRAFMDSLDGKNNGAAGSKAPPQTAQLN